MAVNAAGSSVFSRMNRTFFGSLKRSVGTVFAGLALTGFIAGAVEGLRNPPMIRAVPEIGRIDEGLVRVKINAENMQFGSKGVDISTECGMKVRDIKLISGKKAEVLLDINGMEPGNCGIWVEGIGPLKIIELGNNQGGK